MNSNMSPFDEEHNLTFDDLGWNADSMFSADDVQDSKFDLTKTTEDFLGGLQTALEMVAAPASERDNNDEHISPRGITDKIEHHHSSHNTKGSPKNSGLLKPSENASHSLRTSPNPQNETARDQNENFFVEENKSPKTPSKEPSDPPELLDTEIGNPSANKNRQSGAQKGLHQQQQSIALQAQVSPTREELDAALCPPTPFAWTDGGDECPGTGYGSGSVTRDPLDSLVSLPGYIQFNEHVDPLLDLQGTPEKAAEDDDTLQNFLDLQGQVPQPSLTTSPNEADLQAGLAPNDLMTNYESSLIYPAEPQYDHRQDRVLPIPETPAFLHDHAGSPEQGYVPPNLGMQLDTQTIQEVVQAYQSNMHPHLQSQASIEYGAPTHGLYPSGEELNVSASMQTSFTHLHTASPGPRLTLPVRSTEGIMKRSRKKGIRDPTKPPLTPKRKKSYSTRETVPEQKVAMTPESDPSGVFRRNYAASSATRPSETVMHPRLPFRSSPNGIPSSSVPSAAPYASVNDNLAAPDMNPNGDGASSAKGPSAIEPGRVAKKPGRKGGRINPETAHLSVEERRSLRAKRNRESAEKSRVRRKEQTAELEMSVAELRNENKSLKSDVLRFQAQLSKTSMEITQHTTTPAEREQFLREHTPALFHAMVVLQRVINECPRTFRPHPQTPEIQLKIRR